MLFGYLGVESVSKDFPLKRRYINVCNELINELMKEQMNIEQLLANVIITWNTLLKDSDWVYHFDDNC